ncbi:MAG: HAD family hydrolase [bacterium]
MPDRAVIWDIDGTIISSSLERRFLVYLKQREVLTDQQIARHFSVLLWRGRLPHWHLVKACYLRGLRVDEAEKLMTDFIYQEVLPLVHPSVPAAIGEFADLGCRQLLLSGTLQPLAELLAVQLGIAEVIAASPAVEGDCYTGELTAPVARGRLKVKVAADWLDHVGCTWPYTLAVADHWGDRFLLDKAGEAVVVQPQGRLLRLARRRGWRIISHPDSENAFTLLPDLIKGDHESS